MPKNTIVHLAYNSAQLWVIAQTMIARIRLAVIDAPIENFPRNSARIGIAYGQAGGGAGFVSAGAGEALQANHGNGPQQNQESFITAVK